MRQETRIDKGLRDEVYKELLNSHLDNEITKKLYIKYLKKVNINPKDQSE